MRQLSKQAEQKLIAAIENAAEFVNDGLDPNTAIVKSASKNAIPAGHINLMVHAYNTGRTNKQREHGENTQEKAANFALADIESVLAQLYPKEVKTSAEIAKSAVLSTEYAVSPLGFISRRRASLAKSAAATDVFLSEKAYVAPPRDEHAAAMRAHVQRVKEKRAAEENRRLAAVAEYDASVAMDKLADYFRSPENMTYPDAVKQVELRLGAQGVNVLEKIAAVYPQFKKQKATAKEHFGDDPVYALVEDVLDKVGSFVSAKNNLPPVKVAQAEKKIAPLSLTGSIMPEPVTEIVLKKTGAESPTTANRPKSNSPGKAPGSLVGSTIDAFKKPITGAAEIIGQAGGDSPGSLLASTLGYGADPAEEKLKAYKDLTNPEHELQLKNIRSQATLHDLMNHDPVISGYDPDEVATAFNELATVMPNVIESPAVLQTVLRKRLESGALADFDVYQLLEMDKIRAERDKALLDIKEREQRLI
jgi:hypothetical protein